MDSKASVLIAVYNAVRELELVLTGFCRQSARDFEVVIADDGSGPEMRAFVESFSRRSPFPIKYVSQPDEGFRKSRILNQAILGSSAPCLIFADADCIPHPNFVRAHLDHQDACTVLCGRRVNLSPRMSLTLTPQDILAGKLDHLTPRLVLDALLGRASHLEEGFLIENKILRTWLHRAEPVLFGCNFSLRRSLLEQVNGFNEDFAGYWGEDTELGYRLRAAGAHLRWVRHRAIQYHLHHPQRSKTEKSCALLERARTRRKAVCSNGMRKIPPGVEEIESSTSTPVLSEEVADFLVAGNPELIDLRRRYAAHPASTHSLWSQSFVKDNVDLRRFRADNAYIWQSRGPVTEETYFHTTDYVKRSDRLSVFDRLTEDGMFGAQCVSYDGKKISRDLLDSVLEMNAICEFLGIENLSGVRLLDVGAGYGRLAHRIVEAFPAVKEIICTDAIPESTFLSGFYLKFRGVDEKTAVVPLDNVQDARLNRTGDIDVAVNVHSFSECTLASIRWWLDLLRSAGIPRIFIVPNFGKRLVSTEADGTRENFGRILPDCGYRQVFKRPKFVNAPELDKEGLYPTWYHGFELRH
jgi:GT2 family glycosyltransferase/SAM-dependent methyltransferase